MRHPYARHSPCGSFLSTFRRRPKRLKKNDENSPESGNDLRRSAVNARNSCGFNSSGKKRNGVRRLKLTSGALSSCAKRPSCFRSSGNGDWKLSASCDLRSSGKTSSGAKEPAFCRKRPPLRKGNESAEKNCSANGLKESALKGKGTSTRALSRRGSKGSAKSGNCRSASLGREWKESGLKGSDWRENGSGCARIAKPVSGLSLNAASELSANELGVRVLPEKGWSVEGNKSSEWSQGSKIGKGDSKEPVTETVDVEIIAQVLVQKPHSFPLSIMGIMIVITLCVKGLWSVGVRAFALAVLWRWNTRNGIASCLSALLKLLSWVPLRRVGTVSGDLPLERG
eukprot:RCo045107